MDILDVGDSKGSVQNSPLFRRTSGPPPLDPKRVNITENPQSGMPTVREVSSWSTCFPTFFVPLRVSLRLKQSSAPRRSMGSPPHHLSTPASTGCLQTARLWHSERRRYALLPHSSFERCTFIPSVLVSACLCCSFLVIACDALRLVFVLLSLLLDKERWRSSCGVHLVGELS